MRTIIVKIAVLIFCVSSLIYASESAILSLTATPDTLAPGEQVDYTLTIQCVASSWIFMTRQYITLPEGFTYISGSSSGMTEFDPYINENELQWREWLLMYSGETVVLKFSATSSQIAGSYSSEVMINGYHMSKTTLGPTAHISVGNETAPFLVLNKTVDKKTGLPGDELTYTLTYANSGDGAATQVTIYETITSNTDYIPGTASGNNMTITYSHDGGSTYDNDETLPVTDLLFTLDGDLSAGGSGSVLYKVVVK